MAQFNLKFEIDNAAFDPYTGHEIREVLKRIEELVLHLDYSSKNLGTVRDSNGNSIGQWSVEK